MAEGYVDTERGVEISDTNLDTVGATSLLTTVEDLALWDEDFYHHRVGGPAIIARMVDRGRLNDGSDIDYASRLGLGTHRGLAIVEQPAATPASAPISSAFPSSISRWRSLPISGRSCRATSHGDRRYLSGTSVAAGARASAEHVPATLRPCIGTAYRLLHRTLTGRPRCPPCGA